MTHDDMHRNAFREEAVELLAELEASLLELEDQPGNQDIIDRIFRAMHTIKGSGAMFGFDDIAAFTHDVETVFDLVRNGVLEAGKELLGLTLAARDHIAYLLGAAMSGQEIDFEQGREITRGLKQFLPQKEETTAEEAAAGEDGGQGCPATYRIRFKPGARIFFSGTNPLALLEELAEAGEPMVFIHIPDLPDLETLNPEECYTWWDIILRTSITPEDIRDIFLFVEDDVDLEVTLVEQADDVDVDESYKRLGEILLERGDISEDDLKEVLSRQQPIGKILADQGFVSPQAVESALAEQQVVRRERQMRACRQPVEAATSIRVAADKLDKLVDLVGELVIVQSQLSQTVSERNDPVLASLSEELERLSDELRDSTLGIRMLPIGTTFSKFRRLVRDLSGELQKDIELTTAGAETELDKTVIERLNDPLVHLLRNSIDHGVERPEERIAAGKPPKGSIHLAAEHSGGEVLIRIMDDGAGMDPEVIRAKGVERGFVSPDAELPEKEIFQLICQPGFSTAKTVSSVSGRGVGMDVVKKSIESLRGSLDIDSAKGKGTTLTLKLPLTLAIIDGLQVLVGGEYFVIPLSVVEECVELAKEDQGNGRQQIVNLRGEIVPYLRLREWFGINGRAPDIEQIVVTGIQGHRVGIVVDNVIGEHQTVIKTLGRIYRDVEGISGATIKGDGTMALILDIPKLIQAAVADRA